MKARCIHGAPWYRDDCPGCKGEEPIDPARSVVLAIPFWRIMSREEAEAHLEQAAREIVYEAQVYASLFYRRRFLSTHDITE